MHSTCYSTIVNLFTFTEKKLVAKKNNGNAFIMMKKVLKIVFLQKMQTMQFFIFSKCVILLRVNKNHAVKLKLEKQFFFFLKKSYFLVWKCINVSVHFLCIQTKSECDIRDQWIYFEAVITVTNVKAIGFFFSSKATKLNDGRMKMIEFDW